MKFFAAHEFIRQRRCRSHAEVVVAAASWERRQVSALRARIKIGNDWWTHCMVLSALSEENRLMGRAPVRSRTLPGCGMRWRSRSLDAFPDQYVFKRLPTE